MTKVEADVAGRGLDREKNQLWVEYGKVDPNELGRVIVKNSGGIWVREMRGVGFKMDNSSDNSFIVRVGDSTLLGGVLRTLACDPLGGEINKEQESEFKKWVSILVGSWARRSEDLFGQLSDLYEIAEEKGYMGSKADNGGTEEEEELREKIRVVRMGIGYPFSLTYPKRGGKWEPYSRFPVTPFKLVGLWLRLRGETELARKVLSLGFVYMKEKKRDDLLSNLMKLFLGEGEEGNLREGEEKEIINELEKCVNNYEKEGEEWFVDDSGKTL